MKTTPFFEIHNHSRAKMAPFAGYNMPLHYGSQIEEHEAVRECAGLFDVSHMMITDVNGPDSKRFLRYLIANDVSKLEKAGTGKALYSVMLNETGGVIDDLIVYLMPFGYRIVSNAGTRDKVQNHLNSVAKQFEVSLEERSDFAMVAVQGPKAVEKVVEVMPSWKHQVLELKRFQGCDIEDFFVARTGYTGEDGLEIMAPLKNAEDFWKKLVDTGVAPCGLAARDTLRLEAGMSLYGQEIDETINPLEAGLAWSVDFKDLERNFVGKEALLSAQKNLNKKQVGLVLLGPGVMRSHQVFRSKSGETGVITSGTFSPTLKKSIAIALVPMDTENQGEVEIRGSWHPAEVVTLPFIKKTLSG